MTDLQPIDPGRLSPEQAEALLYIQQKYPDTWIETIRKFNACCGFEVQGAEHIPAKVFEGLHLIAVGITSEPALLPILVGSDDSDAPKPSAATKLRHNQASLDAIDRQIQELRVRRAHFARRVRYYGNECKA